MSASAQGRREQPPLLRDWNDTAAPFPDVCAHALFEQQAARTPDAIALVFREQRLTYRELDARANQLAQLLRRRGVGPETLVGVSLHRSLELVVSLFAVWKAGAAYVPLDPAYPRERLAFMVEDAGLQLLLTEERCRSLLPASDRILCVDSRWPEIAREPAAALEGGATPANLAYVMYTSGSTGKPKGAMILHSGLVNYLTWAIRAYGVTGDGSVPVHTSVSFDLTITSLYPTLLAGGQAELLPEDAGAQNLLAALRAQKDRSLVKITPAHLDLLTRQLRPEELAGLTRTFVIGGENLSAESLQLWRDLAPRTRLVNEYGPTETVVGCCVHEVNDGDPRSGPVPIGRPIANTQLYVLGDRLELLGPGQTGELFIGGAGVARGYLNRPELTRERFIPDPFSGREGARLYKTGDLARYRDDGTLEYLGRLDNQIKLRGYRIELGEIEAAIAGHPAVLSCAVLAREDAPDNKQLVAYVVCRAGEDADDLQTFLAQRLPEYMVPAQTVRLDALPLTPNGKVDRRALPAPSAQNTPAKIGVAPRNPTERAIATIWAELLGLPAVGALDDFFDLGGHSLLAIKVLARIRDALGVDLPQQTIFESSTVAALAALVEGAGGKPPPRAIPTRTGAGPAPASVAQEQLWLLDRLAPGLPTYNIVDSVPLRGVYQPRALRRALDELVRRHEILRTALLETAAGLAQVVRPALEVPLDEHELGALPAVERQPRWIGIIHAQSRAPFDLAAPPLFRAAAVHLSADEHRVLVTFHHAIGDEWSMELVHQELTALYTAFAAGRPSPLPPLPIQYADFAVWQRQALQSESLQAQLAHWKDELRGAPAVLPLPIDRVRPATLSAGGASEPFELSKQVVDRLQALARAEQATLFMIFEAAFAALLHRYSGQDDLLVGTPISTRTHSETQQLIGCFLNTVVLRAQFAPEETFRSLLQQTRRRALNAHAHPDVPFEHLVAALSPERDPGRTPLFQALFILHARGGASRVSQVLAHRELETGTAKFELTLSMCESDRGAEGNLEYSTDLFEAGTIQRMVRQYVALVESIARDPDERIGRLQLLGPADRALLLGDWNDTAAARSGSALHQLFEAQAQRTPDSIAAVFGDQSLTYRALDRSANQLARVLKDRGVGPDVLVGLCVERSLEMLVGLLGILKAGGAYVPLDPSFPPDRLAHVIDDSGLRVLVTHRGLDERLRTGQAAVVRLDRDAAGLARQSDEPLAIAVAPSSLAYVLYTSGSTGKPKGVAIPHAAIVNFLLSMEKTPGLTARDTLLAVTTLSFDIAGLELFLPLAVGARVVIAAREDAVDPRRLLDLMRRSGCTVMQATPATWRALVDSGWRGDPKLRVLCGGEAMPPELARTLLSCAELWNLYGPTETTVWSTLHRVTSADSPPPIGKPIANTQVYVLDAERALVPPGAVGELYIGGDGLARGYLHRPELTAERFVPSPFTPGARLYRTGDLARFRPDGTLECLGRTDHQVKLRGYRVELGEIEAVLARHPAVTSVVVVAREDSPGDKRLVGYFVASGTGDALSSELRALARAALPEYMVPAQLVQLPALPLTPNGKVDRKALPAPSASGGAAARATTPPRTATERAVAAIWTELLNVPPVGALDEFFALGGHSLLAIRVLARVRDVLGVDLPLRALFENPTVAAFAQVVDAASGRAQPRGIRPRAGAGPAPASATQEQLWLVDKLAPGRATYNIVDHLPLPGAYDGAAVSRAVQELVRRHEILRTSLSHTGAGLVQLIRPSLEVPLPEHDLSGLQEDERRRRWIELIHAQGRAPFDLGTAPLLRAAVIHLSPVEHRLLLTLHHAIADEWSMELIHQELGALVPAFAAGRPSPLPALPVQFADYAAWQRSAPQEDAAHAQLAHWKAELHGARALLALPADKTRPAVPTSAGASEVFELPADAFERLQTLARSEQATLFMVLEAAFAALLHRMTGQDDLLVGTPISTRTHSETQQLIGCFLNTVVLRARFAPEETFRSLLQQTRRRALDAYAHPDVPFERLVAELSPERDPGRTPLFQAMFILHGRGGAAPISQLSARRELETGTAKFELTLSIGETERGLAGHVEYNTDLFEAATIRRMVRQYVALVESIARDPDERIGRLQLLGPADRALLLGDWNDTAAARSGSALHQLFEAQAQRTPDSIAAVFGDQSLTYRALDRSANQLARVLKDRGVGPDVLVGLCVERSLEMLVGLLGILKAGGAYVPLDPSFPPDRLAHVIDDSGLRVLVTHRGLDERLRTGQAAVVRLDRDAAGLARQSDEPLAIAVAPSSLAYVLYTSGSTGKPKGVAIPHAAIVNFLLSMEKTPGLTARDTLLAVTMLSFDIAGLELFLPLAVGARVVIAAREDAVDPRRLLDLMRRSGCTVMQATPATWRALVDSGWRGDPKLRVLCGGKAMPPELARTLLSCAELWNLYGPTETTVWSTLHRVTSADSPPPIGKPIANTQVYVLDAERALVPPGAVGELYIGGDGLARGYLHRPELTAERFVPSPFIPGARLYRTGDLARFRPDGTLECLGRTDHQVKLRGYRVELGEIEAVLARHPAVTSVVVVAREDSPGDKRLVGYFVASKTGDALSSELRALARAALPEYMVPAQLVQLPALPLTPNGKVDRKALPAPRRAEEERGEEARTDTERALASLWSELLRVPPPKRDDNFFDLGGESLLAVRLSMRVQERFGVELPLASLLAAPTLRAWAERLDAARGLSSGAPAPRSFQHLVRIQEGSPGRTPFFCVHGAGGNVLNLRDLARGLNPSRPVWGLQARGVDGRAPPHPTVEEAAAVYVAELREQQPRGPYLLGGYSGGGVIAYEMAQQLGACGEHVALLALLDTSSPLLEPGGPTLAMRLGRLRAEKLSYLGNLIARRREQWAERRERERLRRVLARGEPVPADLRGLHLYLRINEAISRYRPKPWNGRAMLFRAETNWSYSRMGDDYGWRQLVPGKLEIVRCAGDHLNLLVGENAAALVAALDRALEQAPAPRDEG